MGKSVGNVLDPVALVAAYGADAVRFFFLKEVDFGQVRHSSNIALQPLPSSFEHVGCVYSRRQELASVLAYSLLALLHSTPWTNRTEGGTSMFAWLPYAHSNCLLPFSSATATSNWFACFASQLRDVVTDSPLNTVSAFTHPEGGRLPQVAPA